MERNTKIIIIILLIVAAVIGVIYASKGYTKKDTFIDEEHTDSFDGLTPKQRGLTPKQRAANDRAFVDIVNPYTQAMGKGQADLAKNITLGILTGGVHTVASLFKKKKKK